MIKKIVDVFTVERNVWQNVKRISFQNFKKDKRKVKKS